MNYYVLYPEAKNVHLIKDVGMIAFKLYERYGYNGVVCCYNNDNYNYLYNEVKGLTVEHIERKYNNSILDGIRFLRKNSKGIDVLQIFHMTFRSALYAYFYKMFNRRGKIFLKLDCTDKLLTIIRSLSLVKRKLLHSFLNKIDIIGVEQKEILEELKKLLNKYSNKILLIPNGIDYTKKNMYDNIRFDEKENIVLNVGRIGSPEKRTEIILEAFCSISHVKEFNWKLVFVGPIEDEFKDYIKEFFKKHEQMADFIEFKGAIYDREKLNLEYNKAKIFCVSSEYESFGISLIEAAAFGDVIVSTDVGIAKELVVFGNGTIVKKDSIEEMGKAIVKYINDRNLEKKYELTKKICRENFNWDRIVDRLVNKLQEK